MKYSILIFVLCLSGYSLYFMMQEAAAQKAPLVNGDSLQRSTLLQENFSSDSNKKERYTEYTPPIKRGMKLVWSDEFNYNGLPDSTKWKYNTGGSGWGNNEKQFYTKDDTANAYVNNGVLSITARKEKRGDNDYTSARLVTKGLAEWTYGYVEIRAKLPAGRGLWPAGWMLGSNIDEQDWPDCGEIDIMEHVGYKKDSIFGTVHTGAYNHVKGTQKGTKAPIKNPYGQFHTFAIDWTRERIDFFLDGNMYYYFKNENKTYKEWPFDAPFFLILNMAVGGNLGGKEGIDNSVFPATFEIDYVRIYQYDRQLN